MDITVTTKIQAPGMTTIEDKTVVTVEARDILTVLVPAGTVDQEVDVSPAALAAQELLYIKSSLYTTGALPTYKVGVVGNPAITLGKPHLYLGGQDESLPAAVDKLFFSNPHTADITVTVLVGRDATP